MNAQDLIKMLQIIDASAERGAIRGDELYIVGELREKLRKTVQEAQEQAQNNVATTSQEAVSGEVVSPDE